MVTLNKQVIHQFKTPFLLKRVPAPRPEWSSFLVCGLPLGRLLRGQATNQKKREWRADEAPKK